MKPIEEICESAEKISDVIYECHKEESCPLQVNMGSLSSRMYCKYPLNPEKYEDELRRLFPEQKDETL